MCFIYLQSCDLKHYLLLSKAKSCKALEIRLEIAEQRLELVGTNFSKATIQI